MGGLLKSALMLGFVVLFMVTSLRWQVRRKHRTSFNDTYYIEDSLAGNGTRYKVVIGANDTAGEYFTVELLMRAQAYGAVKGKPGCQPHHLHKQQEEHIKVLKGMLGYYRGHHTHAATAKAGDEVQIKPGEAHTIWNAGGGSQGGDLLLQVTHKPARYGESFYETLAGLGYEYESPLAVSPLQQVLTYCRAEAVLTSITPSKWQLLENYLLPFAEGIGYRAFYPQYTTTRQQGPSRGSRHADGCSVREGEQGMPVEAKGAYMEEYEEVEGYKEVDEL